jgi:hypothetical protein
MKVIRGMFENNLFRARGRRGKKGERELFRGERKIVFHPVSKAQEQNREQF